MKTFTSRLSALLLALLLLALLCACAKPNTQDPTTKPQGTTPGDDTTEEPRIYPDLPDVRYEGEEFNFLHWLVNDWIYWEEIWVEEYSADILESQVYNRNSKIEQDYGVKIHSEYDNYVQVRTTFDTMVNTGGDDYDVFIGSSSNQVGNSKASPADSRYIIAIKLPILRKPLALRFIS